VASGMSDMIDIFTANTRIGNVFYYKGTGADQQLDLLSGLGTSAPAVPLTRLAVDSAFTPANGNFACTNLNVIGNMYYLRAVGVTCADAAPTAQPVLALPVPFATAIPATTALSWSVVVGATEYRVQVATDPNFTTILVHDSLVPGPAKAVGPLAGGTNHYWRVKARNNFGEGPWSETFLFTTAVVVPDAPVLAAPAGFATDVSVGTSLSWNAVGGAAFYRVQLATEPGFGAPILNDSTVTGTSRAVGVLAGNTDYYWRVSARNTGGTGPWSLIRKFTTGALPLPSVPILVSPANFFGTWAPPRLVWRSSSFTAFYHLQLSTNAEFSSTSFNDSTLSDTARESSGSVFGNNFWRVRARNATGVSVWSEVRSFNLSPDAILPGRLAAFGMQVNGGRALRFNLPAAQRVTIRIFDIHGAKLFSLDETMAAGPHNVALPGFLGGGVRLMDIRIGGARETLKLQP
jgi:hypothetical protein